MTLVLFARQRYRRSEARMVRVSMLAKELGITTKQVLVFLSETGEIVKSASSSLSPAVAARVRQHFKAGAPPRPQPDVAWPRPAPRPAPRVGRNPFGVGEPPPRMPRRPQPGRMPGAFEPLPTPRPRRGPDPRFQWWKEDEPSPLVQLFLLERIVPTRDDAQREKAQGHWFVSEVRQAKYMAEPWAAVIGKYLWPLEEVEGWVVNFPEVSAELAAWWSTVARLAPEHLRLRLWYSRINDDRDTLVRQIETQRTTREDAASWVRTYLAAEASA